MFPRCVYSETGKIQYKGDNKYIEFRDRISGDIVKVGMRWHSTEKV